MTAPTRESVIGAARSIASETGQPVSRATFARRTGISLHHVYALFPDGGWSEVLAAAGLPHVQRRWSDDELLEQYHSVACDLGRIPTWRKLASVTGIATKTIRRRFGGTTGFMARYREWLERREPQSPILRTLQADADSARPREGSAEPSGSEAKRTASEWRPAKGPQYGAPIDFRGLRHAPINEFGVVYLFGLVSRDLGFLVEAVHAAYPDCEAKRCVNRRADRWQRVRIEFEYKSSHFSDHVHDPRDCDLVVCWENDWPECPLEVLELRAVIKDLPAT